MKPWKKVVGGCVLCCLLAGCGSSRDRVVPSPPPTSQDPSPLPSPRRAWVVLLPDPEGKVGTIQVTTEGGSQTIDKAGCGTVVEGFAKPPTSPTPFDEKDIARAFGQALSGQPDPTGRFVSFLLYFESDTTRLAHESRKLLPEVARSIKQRQSREVYVVGHTDRVGPEAYNLELSSRRANYVRNQLLLNGVRSSALVVSFRGEAMPLLNTEDEVAEPLNRRVEVIVR